MGARLLSGLPEGHSLTADVAAAHAEDPGDVIAVLVLRPKYEKVGLEAEDSETTTVYRITDLEHFADMDAESLLKQLRDRHAERTGDQGPIPGVDDDVPGSSTGDSKELVRQLDLARKEHAAALREKADETSGDDAQQLESEAESFERGFRDEELRAQLAPAFLEAEQPSLDEEEPTE